MLKKFTLVSNNICFGPCPESGDEVEQRLTVSSTGRVWFTGYAFCVSSGRYPVRRRIQTNIKAEHAQRLLDLLEIYFGEEHLIPMATDVGSWELMLYGESVSTFNGSLCEDLIVEDVPLSQYIRQLVTIDDLFVFDGNPEPEEE